LIFESKQPLFFKQFFPEENQLPKTELTNVQNLSVKPECKEWLLLDKIKITSRNAKL
jgi:hypothetical protein